MVLAYGVVTLLGMLFLTIECAIPAALCVALAVLLVSLPDRPKFVKQTQQRQEAS